MKVKSSILILMFLLLSLLSVETMAINIPPGGGGSVGTVFTLTYVTPAVYQTKQVINYGSNLDTGATWSDPSYLSIIGTNLQILPDTEYINNNGTFSVPNLASIGLNVTFEIGSGSAPYGQFLIAFGVDVAPTMMIPKLYPSTDGIVVFVEHSNMANEHLMAYFNGVLVLNVTVNNLATGVDYGIGFSYSGTNYVLTVYWYNGTVYHWSVADVQLVNGVPKNTPLSVANDNFVIGASNAGPVYGYSQWEIVNYMVYQNVETQTPVKLSLTYYATVLSNNVYALTAFTGAYNPVNITTNASSWSITAMPKVVNYSVSGSVYPVSGSLSYVTNANQILFIDSMYPTSSIASWYINATVTFQLVTTSTSESLNVTIPIVITAFAEGSSITCPHGTYLSGQTISFTNVTFRNFPSGLGYTVESPVVVGVELNGAPHSLPYSFTPYVSVPTTYTYNVIVDEAGLYEGSYYGSFTVIPIQNSPVIFVSAPSSAYYGSTITIQFQFTQNGPISNVSSLANKAGLLQFSYWKLVSPSTTIILDLSQIKYGSLVFIPENGANIYINFNGTSNLLFNIGENILTLTVSSTSTSLSLGGTTITLGNTTPIIGIGVYNNTFNWLYIDGAILQNAYAGQSYVVSIGNSTATLTQYVSGYTNASGWGVVKVPITFHNFELINIYWYGVKNVLLNISVITPVTSTSSTVNVTTLNYNYTQPFSNNIQPTSSLYNFSNYQPWAFIIGIVIVAIMVLLGWKFGSTAGASGGGIAGVILSAYLGLLPWYIYFIIIMIIAMVLAKLIIDKFMGNDEP
jgi:hypothetical protein